VGLWGANTRSTRSAPLLPKSRTGLGWALLIISQYGYSVSAKEPFPLSLSRSSRSSDKIRFARGADGMAVPNMDGKGQADGCSPDPGPFAAVPAGPLAHGLHDEKSAYLGRLARGCFLLEPALPAQRVPSWQLDGAGITR
jgi:hypothetical protein